MAIETGRERAVYAADPAQSRGRLHAEPAEPDAQRFPPRLRPDHPFRRLPPAGAQDAGLRLSRRRPLPHAADPHAGSRRRSPARWRARSGSTRTSAEALALGARSRPSAVRPCRRARARRLPCGHRRLRPQRAGAAHRHRSRAPLCGIRRPQSDLGNARRPGQAQRSAHRPRGRAGRPLCEARRAGGDPCLFADSGSRTVVLRQRRSAGCRACPTTSPTTPTTSTTACAPICSRSTTLPACRWSASILREIDARASRSRAGAARA